MTTLSKPRAMPAINGRATLHNGDRMKQPEFHRRYEAYPEDVKFELVGGIVYMASPLRRPHGVYHVTLSGVFALYEAATPGVEAADNATVILGEESEPQPDLNLRVLPECGGQTRVNDEEYLEGAPELLAEIAHSSRALDLNQKRQDYEQAGVLEYLVLSLEERALHWFDFTTGRPIRADRDGVARSRVFPGLWIHVASLLDRDGPPLHATLQQGLAGRAHAAFVKRLDKARRGRK
jgi:Uma2 family endonuclease